MGFLTTHVLDTARGIPAANMNIELYRIIDGQPVHLKTVVTNDDGRVDGPILPEDEFAVGIYELRFFAGDYLRSHNSDLQEPLFLDMIPLRFGIAQAGSHYHVPLLISPFGYSTYRGS